jgi:3-hydroxyisobutyrate dehydrogenase-like beta-hydroxyacid dehydrogenase
MTNRLTLIGFGEAGSSFACAAGWGSDARAYDLRAVDNSTAGVTICHSLAEAIADSPIVISVVTADAAIDVARHAAQCIAPGALFFDMNSVSPDSKRQAATAIESAGGRYVDTAVMAPVNPQLMAVPLLLSGKYAEAGCEALAALRFTNRRIVGDDVGKAASIKLIRSVMVKGIEALTGEMMAAADKAGVAYEVLASLGEGWAERAPYNLERMAKHGLRRAAEMEESAKTLAALGVDPVMTRGTILRQRGAAL